MDILLLILLAILALALIAAPIHFVVALVRSRQGRRQPPLWSGLALWLIVVGYVIVYFAGQMMSGSGTKQSEAKTNLGAIFTTQVAYFGERNTYAGGPEAFSIMSWSPMGQPRYSYFCGEQVMANVRGPAVALRPGGDWPYPVKPASSATGFTCLAVGNIDNDPALDVWVMSDSKQLVNLENDNPKRKSILPLVFTGLFALLVATAVLDIIAYRRRKKPTPA